MVKKVVVIIPVVSILFSLLFLYISFIPLHGEKILFVVKKGENFSTAASHLKKQKLILSRKLFLFLVKLTNSQKRLKPGIYRLSGDDCMFVILKKLKSNSENFIRITIPEGNNIKQTADIIANKVKINKDKFIKIALDKNLEGYLMPETYFVYPGITESELIQMMYDEFKKKITDEMYKRAEEINIPFKDIIIIASIIEKEGAGYEERRLIAAVFYNRLKKKMMLQSCATVLYAINVTKEKISIKDIKFKSPYNTYMHFGLPPGPISNPGMESIKAALYPSDSDVLYFVSAGNGKHLFAENFTDHVKNKYILNNKSKVQNGN
ncbi:MAG: endolytic transglycosylase MltG [Endomicrobium sp.]|jgi:UPF0755 protein|nr:endolytic transglycosylase MltG [Endomicrobium sp.]